MYAIEVLVAEHDNVLRLNRVLRAACLSILDGKAVDTADFRQCVSLIRTYADKHHHGKEELLLFSEMVERLGSAAEKLVRNGMLVEHDLGRLYVGQLEAALDRYAGVESKDAALDILSNAMAYADLLGRHIDRENNVVYRFAENNLPAEVLAALDRQTADFEAEAEGRGVQTQALETLERLEKKYGI